MPIASHVGRLLLGGFVLTAGCTPLGAWLYDDPSFALARVGLRQSGSGPDSLELVLAGCNPNDYDLMGFGFEAQLRVDGREVGAVRTENTYQLVMRDSTLITVMLPVQSAENLAPGQAVASLYELVGQTRIHTPIGDRRVEMVQKGEVRREEGALAWHGWKARACRPGLATLPGAWDTKSTLPTPEIPRTRPAVEPDYTPPAGRPDGRK
ncbi:MAG: hypothetical protein ACREMH_03295 [Gemmatimonadales bacterium]